MRFFTFLFLLLSICSLAQKKNKYDTFFEKGNRNQSASYAETIAYYKLLADDFTSIEM